jgi:N-methylhydantoinase A
MQIGVDVGGTFTDLVAGDASGRLRELKVPTTPANPALGVLDGIARLGLDAGVPASVAHGTTAVTNAIVEGRVARVALVTTRGFRDVLEIARQNRLHLYDLHAPAKPEPLVPRSLRFEVTERVAADGTVVTPLDARETASLTDALRSAEVDVVAVCLLHAYANPDHERALKAALAPHAHVSVSSEINAELREYERTSTTVLNAAVMPLATRYVDELVARLGGRSLHLLHSAGGMMSAQVAKLRPLAMAMSGPAAGVAAAAWVTRRLGLDHAIAFDMGGTTTDVCLIAGGVAETASQRRLGDHPVRLPMVAVESIGAGGGSIAFVDAAGALKVGPRSAGAVPGPACYGLGGSEATVTDANLVLGYLDAERVYGGAIRLDRARAEAALSAIGRRFGLSTVEAALGIVEIANSSMLRALRLVSVQRGWDLRRFALIAYGGAGPIHAGALARAAGVTRVIVPAHSGAFSALGCLVSPLRYDAVQTYRAALGDIDAKRIDERFAELEARCREPLLADGVAPGRIDVRRSTDLRYTGQNYELEVPWDADTGRLRDRFEARHRQLYGYATGDAIECVNLRVTAMLARETTGTRAPADLRAGGVGGPSRPPTPLTPAFFPGTGEVAVPRYDRASLGEGVVVDGPAIVEDEWSTTVVHPGQRCTGTVSGDLVIEVRP